MDVFEAIRTRRSVHKYADKPVDWDKVVTILEAGKFAPNAGNLSNFKFITIRDEDARKKIANACLQQHWMAQAPVHIAIVSEPEKSRRFYGVRGERFYTIQDCAAAIENMLLTAHSLGLGSCWVGAFQEEKLRELLQLPESIMIHAVIVIGYAAEKPVMPPKYRIEHYVFLEKWGQKKNIPFSSMGWWSVRTEKAVREAGKKLKEQQEFLVSALPGVGLQTAKLLLEHFGSVRALVNASPEEITKIKGVGEKTAEKLIKMFGEEYKVL